MALAPYQGTRANTLQESAEQTSDGNSSAVPTPKVARGLVYILDCTAVGGAADTLDVYIQTLLDGVNWLDVAHFAQVLGSGAAIRHVIKQTLTLTQAGFSTATALGANAVREMVGSQLRVRWDVSATAPAFTFSVVMVPI